MRMWIAALGIALLGACMAGLGMAPREEVNRWALARARAVGEPAACIPVSLIRNSEGRDDRTIDFTLATGRIMRNRLPADCPGLGFESRFQHRATLGRLCASDLVTILRSGGSGGRTCTLGMFQEVEIAPR